MRQKEFMALSLSLKRPIAARTSITNRKRHLPLTLVCYHMHKTGQGSNVENEKARRNVTECEHMRAGLETLVATWPCEWAWGHAPLQPEPVPADGLAIPSNGFPLLGKQDPVNREYSDRGHQGHGPCKHLNVGHSSLLASLRK